MQESRPTQTDFFISTDLRLDLFSRTITELWGKADSWDGLIAKVQEHPERWPQYLDVSFKFSVVTFGGTIEHKDKAPLINRFAFTGFMGKIDLKTPEEEFLLIADYGIDPDVTVAHTFYMGRLVKEMTLADSNKGEKVKAQRN